MCTHMTIHNEYQTKSTRLTCFLCPLKYLLTDICLCIQLKSQIWITNISVNLLWLLAFKSESILNSACSITGGRPGQLPIGYSYKALSLSELYRRCVTIGFRELIQKTIWFLFNPVWDLRMNSSCTKKLYTI